MIAKGYKFYIGLYSEILRNLLVLKIRTMATNFSPCEGSYVLNQLYCLVWMDFTYQPVERYRAIMALLLGVDNGKLIKVLLLWNIGRYLQNLCMTDENATSLLSWLLDKMDFIDL